MDKKILLLSVLLLSGCMRELDQDQATNLTFEDCVANGGVIMEIYPRQCRDKNGNVFVEQAADENIPTESSGSGQVCTDQCGNGVCEEVVCERIGCPCAETAISCPSDCK